MAGKAVNPLLSMQTSSDSDLQVTLHPLPILSISDQITRSSVRQQSWPLVWALLGQQNGREITVEESFECLVQPGENGELGLDTTWFDNRLGQMKLVFKQPQLDLVGWGTLLSEDTGPVEAVLPIHKYLTSHYNESAILLGFDPARAHKPVGGKLPIIIYESNYEAEGSAKDGQTDEEDKEMKDGDTGTETHLKFRPLPYSIEAEEAEMIGMAFVHTGGANATSTASDKKTATATNPDAKGKGAATDAAEATTKTASATSSEVVLTREEQDMLAAINTRKNALLMLLKRIRLFIACLERLPASFTDSSLVAGINQAMTDLPEGQVPSAQVLRSLQALVTNVALVAQDPGSQLDQELRREANDVQLVSLLGDMLNSAEELRLVGRQFSVVEAAKLQKARVPDLAHVSTSGSRYFGP